MATSNTFKVWNDHPPNTTKSSEEVVCLDYSVNGQNRIVVVLQDIGCFLWRYLVYYDVPTTCLGYTPHIAPVCVSFRLYRSSTPHRQSEMGAYAMFSLLNCPTKEVISFFEYFGWLYLWLFRINITWPGQRRCCNARSSALLWALSAFPTSKQERRGTFHLLNYSS